MNRKSEPQWKTRKRVKARLRAREIYARNVALGLTSKGTVMTIRRRNPERVGLAKRDCQRLYMRERRAENVARGLTQEGKPRIYGRISETERGWREFRSTIVISQMEEAA